MSPKATLTEAKRRYMRQRPDSLAEDRLKQLRGLFPEAFSEGKVDLDKLRESLGAAVDSRPERYSFSWAGRRDAIRFLQQTSSSTLVPSDRESVRPDDTGNVFVEGDNLEVLQLLKKPYFSKVKLIYIDPPYNTGRDFLYPDNFKDPLEPYLQLTGQKDSAGNVLTSNPETSGRYHSAWLSMLYPRLFLARQLLTEDGVIFVSVDDNEVYHLRLLLNEVFGEENFVTSITWRRTKNKSNQAIHFANVVDYILVYAKSRDSLRTNQIGSEGTGYNYEDEKGKYSRNTILDKKRGSHHFRVISPKGQEIVGPWVIKEEEFHRLEKAGLIHWSAGKKETPYSKVYMEDTGGLSPPDNFWDSKVHGSNQDGSLDLERIFDAKSVMDFPKPVELMKSIVRIGSGPEDLVMDFFAGSCTLAQAILELNHDEGTHRKFIVVQLPEPCPDDSVAARLGYRTIADIGKERIRRVLRKLENDLKSKLPSPQASDEDLGLKVFRLSLSNLLPWQPPTEGDGKKWVRQMALYDDPLREGWKPIDVVWEVALREGLLLTSRVEQVTAKKIWRVKDLDSGESIAVDLAERVDPEIAQSLGLNRNSRLVCRDIALTDEDAANLALQCDLRTL